MLAEDAATIAGLDPAVILAALRKREALGSTGVGNGIVYPIQQLPVLIDRLAYWPVLITPSTTGRLINSPSISCSC